MRSTLLSAVALSALVLSACDDDGGVTGPGPKEQVSLDFCEGSVPLWLAIRNETEAWQEVTGDASGTFTFDATPRVSIAIVTSSLSADFATEIINVTRDELSGVAGVACSDLAGTKTLSGTVNGLTGAQIGRMAMALEIDGVTASNTSYSFSGLPSGPLDLVATRHATAGTQPPDRVIVRRAIDLPSASTITPPLEFSGTESRPLAQHIVTFNNRGTDNVDVITEVFTANGTNHRLMQFTGVNNTTGSAFVSLPEAARIPGDLHLLSTFASAASGTREVSLFYAVPADATFTYGPALSTPTLTVASSTPYRRPRLTIASQAEYDAAMEAFFSQQSGVTFRTLTIVTSSAFLGGRPATWELELPDLSAAGYENSWAFQSGQINANGRGYDADVGLILGAAPQDGDMIISAFRSAQSVVANQLEQLSYRAHALSHRSR